MADKFYLVWGPRPNPMKWDRHSNYTEACREAEQLVRGTGEPFYIMVAMYLIKGFSSPQIAQVLVI